MLPPHSKRDEFNNLLPKIREIQQENQRLQQRVADLEATLEVTTLHATAIEAELQQANQRLKKELHERYQAEMRLKILADAITQRNLDLEILLDTLCQHGDAIYDQWHEKVKQAQEAAGQDCLTQIANRRKLEETLKVAWQLMERQNQPLSLVVCDIDCFKGYNDTYGHLMGDRCLRQVAEVLDHTVTGPADLVARYGGEEFLVVLPETDLDGAIEIAQRMCNSVRRLKIPHALSTVNRYITLSFGVASTIPKAGRTAKLLFEAADRALYQAKRLGRNQVCWLDLGEADEVQDHSTPNV